MPSSVQLIRASNLSDVAEYAYAAAAPKDARLIFLAGHAVGRGRVDGGGR